MFHSRNGGSLLILDDHAPPGFVIDVDLDLHKIASLTLGKDLLELFKKRYAGIGKTDALRRPTGICYTSPLLSLQCLGGPLAARAQPSHFDLRRRVPRARYGAQPNFSLPAPAANGWVFYDPTLDAELAYTQAIGIPTPTWVALAHELIHAFHFVSGDSEFEPTAPLPWLREEARTVGLGPYRNARISENALRAEAGLPRRNSYAPGWDCDGVPSRTRVPTRQEFRAALGTDFDLTVGRLLLRHV
jgi:hypothetical protein